MYRWGGGNYLIILWCWPVPQRDETQRDLEAQRAQRLKRQGINCIVFMITLPKHWRDTLCSTQDNWGDLSMIRWRGSQKKKNPSSLLLLRRSNTVVRLSSCVQYMTALHRLEQNTAKWKFKSFTYAWYRSRFSSSALSCVVLTPSFLCASVSDSL